MQICEKHWSLMREAIDKRGLTDMIGTNMEAMQQIVDTINGKTPQTFDPLLHVNNAIWSNALRNGGAYMLGPDENGGHYCPLCELVKNAHILGIDHDWIGKAADDARDAYEEFKKRHGN